VESRLRDRDGRRTALRGVVRTAMR
jgi:hypothetical protein